MKKPAVTFILPVAAPTRTTIRISLNQAGFTVEESDEISDRLLRILQSHKGATLRSVSPTIDKLSLEFGRMARADVRRMIYKDLNHLVEFPTIMPDADVKTEALWTNPNWPERQQKIISSLASSFEAKASKPEQPAVTPADIEPETIASGPAHPLLKALKNRLNSTTWLTRSFK